MYFTDHNSTEIEFDDQDDRISNSMHTCISCNPQVVYMAVETSMPWNFLATGGWIHHSCMNITFHA